MRQKMLAPSLLSADFGHLSDDLEMLNKSQCDWFHLDIMDGVFVPNISFGFPVIKSITKLAQKPLDVHLMIVQPEKFIQEVKQAGAYIMNVHQEACPHLHRVLQQIRQAGMKSGVTLNPATPLSAIEEILEETDLVLLMSVNPGFGGQKFISSTIDKIRRLREMIDHKNLSTLIEVDGGVNRSNAAMLYEAGADVLVAGSAIFNATNPAEEIVAIKGM